MKTKVLFLCSICDHAEDTQVALMAHEATHFNLTPEEYDQWYQLRRKASRAGAAVSRTKNRKTDAEFDEKIKALVDFEAVHGLTGKSQPIHV